MQLLFSSFHIWCLKVYSLYTFFSLSTHVFSMLVWKSILYLAAQVNRNILLPISHMPCNIENCVFIIENCLLGNHGPVKMDTTIMYTCTINLYFSEKLVFWPLHCYWPYLRYNQFNYGVHTFINIWQRKFVSYIQFVIIILAMTCYFQHCGILTSVDSNEPVEPPIKLRNSKWCWVNSLTLIKYSSD